MTAIRKPDGAVEGREPVEDALEPQPAWLLSPYSAPLWRVADTLDPTRTADLDFRYPLADGRCLTSTIRYYPAIKKVARWMRDSRFSRIDDSATHVAYIRGLMTITHALTLRNIWSYSDVSPYELEQILDECPYGADALLHASERVHKYLDHLQASNAPVPQYRAPNGTSQRRIAALEILRACNLPDGARQLPRVAWYLNKAALNAGFESQALVARLDQPPELETVTSTTLVRYLHPFEYLYVMRRQLAGEHLQFRPFSRSVGEIAKVLGVEPKRTPTVPPKLALHLLEHSAKWVCEYAKDLLSALRETGSDGKYYGGRLRQFDILAQRLPQSGPPGSPWPVIVRGVLRGNAGDSALAFSEAISYLATACFIQIATFSAGRHDAILSLEDDCLRGSDANGWWLRLYAAKTLQRHDWIPVPHIVARAVDVLLELSRSARKRSGSSALFQWISPFSIDPIGALLSFDPARTLDAFAAHVGIPQYTDKTGLQKVWHWSPHQFRRFFAILYFYRFDGADISVISHHLRHFDIERTRRYLTQDPDVAAIWTSVEWGYTGDLARSIVAADRVVTGGMGAHLSKLARRIAAAFRRNLQIVSPDRVGAALALVMRRKSLVLTPKPWVTCSCPRTAGAARKAACRSGQAESDSTIGPDFSAAGPLVCPSCPYAVIEASRTPFVDDTVQHLELVATSDVRAQTLFGEHERLQLLRLTEIRSKHYTSPPATRSPEDGA